MTDILATYNTRPFQYVIHEARPSDDGRGLCGPSYHDLKADRTYRDVPPVVFAFSSYTFGPVPGVAHRNLKVEDEAGIAALLEASRAGSVPVVIEYEDRNGRHSIREATVSNGGDNKHVAVQTDDGPRSFLRSNIQAVSI